MDSPPNPHDAHPLPVAMAFAVERPDQDGRLALPANVSTVLAEDLRASLVLAADHEQAIIIDAAETCSIGQAALQLLVAARLEADRLELPFAILNARAELVRRIDALGLAGTLGLTVEEEAAA